MADHEAPYEQWITGLGELEPWYDLVDPEIWGTLTPAATEASPPVDQIIGQDPSAVRAALRARIDELTLRMHTMGDAQAAIGDANTELERLRWKLRQLDSGLYGHSERPSTTEG